MITGLLDDFSYGLRALAKNRGFALAAILSLALGIGANTTVFTLLNAILLRPLPVAEPNVWQPSIRSTRPTPGTSSAPTPTSETIGTETRSSLPWCSILRF